MTNTSGSSTSSPRSFVPKPRMVVFNVPALEASRQAVSIAQYDAVVVGAGPYGLSTAAHLLGRGLRVAVFGKAMELWRDHMPKGMLLRSQWWATNLSDPGRRYTFQRFFRESRRMPGYPVPLETFLEYALWFQRHAVPDVDETYTTPPLTAGVDAAVPIPVWNLHSGPPEAASRA